MQCSDIMVCSGMDWRAVQIAARRIKSPISADVQKYPSRFVEFNREKRNKIKKTCRIIPYPHAFLPHNNELYVLVYKIPYRRARAWPSASREQRYLAYKNYTGSSKVRQYTKLMPTVCL